MLIDLVIPTRNRKFLLKESLNFLYLSSHLFNKIYISDTSTDLREDNARICSESCIGNLVYVPRPATLDAVSHWDTAIRQSSADYVFTLTDKMLLLPNAMQYVVDNILAGSNPEIINWTALNFFPKAGKIGFANGTLEIESFWTSRSHENYVPKEVLRLKAFGNTTRAEQSAKTYAQGKICFGGFSRELLNKITKQYGSICSGATHDYSAMVRALTLAKSGVVLNEPAIIHVNLAKNASTGSRIDYSSAHAKDYLESLPDHQVILSKMLVPNVYSSVTNLISFDFRENFDPSLSTVGMDSKNAIMNIAIDLSRLGKQWKNKTERKTQIDLLKSSQYYPAKFNIFNGKKLFMEFILFTSSFFQIYSEKELQISSQRESFLGMILYFPRKFSNSGSSGGKLRKRIENNLLDFAQNLP